MLGLLAGAACSGPPDQAFTTLEMNVRVSDSGVFFYARENARPCDCSWGEFADPGSCVFYDDTIGCSCEPEPVTCIDEVRLERDGVVVTTLEDGLEVAAWSMFAPEVMAAPHDLVVDGCGSRGVIPLRPRRLAVPDTQSATLENGDLAVRWSSSPPAASALVSIAIGLGFEVCHVRENPAMIRDYDGYVGKPLFIAVSPLEAEVERTELGTARVWYGNSVNFDMVAEAPAR